MKFFEVSTPGTAPVLVDLAEADEVRLGESGRGRELVVIPITGTGSEVRAKKTDKGFVLVRGDRGDEGRCLVAVQTAGEYDRYRSYRLFDAKDVEVVTTGFTAQGSAGGIGRYPHHLLLATEGAEFRLNSKYQEHWYRFVGGQWLLESPEQRNARLALAAVAAGEGGWL